MLRTCVNYIQDQKQGCGLKKNKKQFVYFIYINSVTGFLPN